MAYHVYILECLDGLFYTGLTGNLEKRLTEHKEGRGGPITKNRRPVKLVYKEKLKTRKEAAKREKEIKGWRREKKIKLINSQKT